MADNPSLGLPPAEFEQALNDIWAGRAQARKDAMASPRTEDQLRHLYALVYDDLHLCGCGQPDAAVDLIRRLLDLAPFYDNPAAVDAEFGGNAGAKHIVLSVLDDAGLIEHGGSITSSWLTVKGRAVRHLLSLGSGSDLDDALRAVGYPHNGEPCPGSCWAAWAPPGGGWR